MKRSWILSAVVVCILGLWLVAGCTVHHHGNGSQRHQWNDDDDWNDDDHWNDDDDWNDGDDDFGGSARQPVDRRGDLTRPTDGVEKIGGETPEAAYVAIKRNMAERDTGRAMSYMTEYGRAEGVFGLAVTLEFILAGSGLADEHIDEEEMGLGDLPGGMQVETNPLRRTARRWAEVKDETRFDPEVLEGMEGWDRAEAVNRYRRLHDAPGLLLGGLEALLMLFEGGMMPEGTTTAAWKVSGSASDEQILKDTTVVIEEDYATITRVETHDGETTEVHESYVRLAEHGNRWFFDGNVDEPLGRLDDDTTVDDGANDGIEPVGGNSAEAAYVSIQRAFARQEAAQAMAYMTEHGRGVTVLVSGISLEILLDPIRQALDAGMEDPDLEILVRRWNRLIDSHNFELDAATEAMDSRATTIQAYRGLSRQPVFLEGSLDAFLSLLRMGSLPQDVMRFVESQASDADILRGVSANRQDADTVILEIEHPADDGEEPHTEHQRYVRLADDRWYYDGNLD